MIEKLLSIFKKQDIPKEDKKKVVEETKNVIEEKKEIVVKELDNSNLTIFDILKFAEGEECYNGPINDNLIEKIQNEIGGYKLPKKYIEVLKTKNGGPLKDSKFMIVKNYRGNEIDELGFFNPILLGLGYELYGILYDDWNPMNSEFNHNIPEGIIPFFRDGDEEGWHYICFDYRECGKDGIPKITDIIDDEVITDESGEELWIFKMDVIANNFEEFVMSLSNESRID